MLWDGVYGGGDVMKPTDGELEACAQKFDVMRAAYEAAGVSGEYGAEAMEEAAAMLRACKGRVRVKPLVWEGDDNYQRSVTPCGMTSYGIDVWKSNATGEITRVAMDGENYVSVRLAKAAAQADYEARILAALEPAPDHETWSAVCVAWRLGVEAAVATIHENRVEWLTTPYDEWVRSRSRTAEELIEMALATATPPQEELFSKIRALKKGPPND